MRNYQFITPGHFNHLLPNREIQDAPSITHETSFRSAWLLVL
jgi:hypothetical protein